MPPGKGRPRARRGAVFCFLSRPARDSAANCVKITHRPEIAVWRFVGHVVRFVEDLSTFVGRVSVFIYRLSALVFDVSGIVGHVVRFIQDLVKFVGSVVRFILSRNNAVENQRQGAKTQRRRGGHDVARPSGGGCGVDQNRCPVGQGGGGFEDVRTIRLAEQSHNHAVGFRPCWLDWG